MEHHLPLFSLAGSAFSAILTIYFWLVRSRREKPNLRSYLADKEFFLGNSSADVRQIGVNLGILIANYSALPDALLGVRAWLKKTDGAWMPIQSVAFDKQTPQPFNLPALTTALVRLKGVLSFAYSTKLEEGKILPAYLGHHLAAPREIKIELASLNDRKFTAVLTWPTEG